MYYLFIIKNKFLKTNSEYLFEILYKLKYMHKENYSYGVTLYNSICDTFDIKALENYINSKCSFKYRNYKYYLDSYNFIEIRKSCCIINNDRYLREILCIFYIYNKNIFVCNFDTEEYFWLRDKFK